MNIDIEKSLEQVTPNVVSKHIEEMVSSYTNSEEFNKKSELEKQDRNASYNFMLKLIKAISDTE